MRISWSTQTTRVTDTGDLEALSAEHTLELDAVTSEIHESTSVLTEHAVESGAPLTDHKRAQPARVTVEGWVSNTPLDAPPPSGYDAGAQVTASRSKRQDVGAVVVVFSAPFTRTADVETTLRRLQSEATPVTLTTDVRTYEDVQIVGVKIPRQSDDGDAWRFTLDLQEIRVAEARTAAAPQPREPRGARRRDRGGQEGQDGSRSSVVQRFSEDYQARRAGGESTGEAALGALGAAFGG